MEIKLAIQICVMLNGKELQRHTASQQDSLRAANILDPSIFVWQNGPVKVWTESMAKPEKWLFNFHPVRQFEFAQKKFALPYKIHINFGVKDKKRV